MKVLLVMAGLGRKPREGYARSWLMEPLGLAMLAAVTPPDVEVQLADDRLDAIPYDRPVDAVAITLETYTARRAYAIAGEFRRRGVPVIFGGYHATLMPQEAAQYADAVVEGEAEALWPMILGDLRAGRLQRRYRGQRRPLPPGLQPQRLIFGRRKYLPLTLVETGRGCRFACDFCSVSRFYRQQATARRPEDVLADIEHGGRRDVFFVDDNIVADPQRARRLFAALEGAGVRWVSQGSINMADDPQLLATIARSGCRGLLVGFESLSPTTLSAMGKSWNQAARDYRQAIRRIHDAGLAIYGTFVFGYDTDDADAIDRTVEFAIEQRLFMAAFNHLVPFPGTPLYARLQQEGRLRSKAWWLDEHFRFGEVPFHPRGLSAEELGQRCYQARARFYRLSSVIARARNVRGNLHDARSAATYLWLNLFSGREARRRQGLPLGQGFDAARMPQPREAEEVMA